MTTSLHPTQILCPIQSAARKHPQAPALVMAGRVIRYGMLDRLVEATARRLEEQGGGTGTRIALALPNGWRYVVLLMAAIRLGAVACPLSTRLPVSEVAAQRTRLKVELMVSERIEALGGISAEDLVPPEAMASSGTDVWLSLSRPATIVFTSGSTAAPKAAVHSLGNHYYSAIGSNENIRLGMRDRWLLSLPLYHVGGIAILFRCLLAGATVVIPEDGEPVAEAVSRYEITHVSMVSTQLLRLLRTEGETTKTHLKAVLLGGSAIPPSLVQEAMAVGLPIHTSYGLTEMASQVTATPPGAAVDRLLTSGRVLPFRQVKISAEGEVLVRGETCFQGYADATGMVPAVDEDGWYHTGDLGRLDAEGYLHVLGRRDSLFISGGENIQPEEIEQTLCRLEGVMQAVVVPVPDDEFGARPVAFVRGAAADSMPDALRERLRPLLPSFKIPVAFYPWPEREALLSMKVDRTTFQMRALRLQRGGSPEHGS